MMGFQKKKPHNRCFLPSEALETPLCVAYNQMLIFGVFIAAGKGRTSNFQMASIKKSESLGENTTLFHWS